MNFLRPIHGDTVITRVHTEASGTTNFHLSKTPPSLLLIPFARDPDYIPRTTIFEQIERKCAVPGSWAALVGFGGVGKSQIAIKYAYQAQDQSRGTWVFWVHASNYCKIADCVKIAGQLNPKANIFKLVHDWLRGSKS